MLPPVLSMLLPTNSMLLPAMGNGNGNGGGRPGTMIWIKNGAFLAAT